MNTKYSIHILEESFVVPLLFTVTNSTVRRYFDTLLNTQGISQEPINQNYGWLYTFQWIFHADSK